MLLRFKNTLIVIQNMIVLLYIHTAEYNGYFKKLSTESAHCFFGLPIAALFSKLDFINLEIEPSEYFRFSEKPN